MPLDHGNHRAISMLNFCTFFDHRYLHKGLALYSSLRRHSSAVRLYVLCMDVICHEALAKLNLPSVYLIALSDFEASDSELLGAKANRSIVEYYFTCTPSLPLYIFRHFQDVDCLTYIDSDFFFFSDPKNVVEEVSRFSVSIVPHRFPHHLKSLEKIYGVFNVGWLTFRRDEVALACLRRWREQCIEWCFDRLENGRFADQMYLDEWPALFPETHIISHKGVDLAPCNIANYRIDVIDDQVRVDDDPLICFHFFGLKEYQGILYYLSLQKYGQRPTRRILSAIYEPYFRAMAEGAQQAKRVLADLASFTSLRELTQNGSRQDLTAYFQKKFKKLMRYNVIARELIMRRFVIFLNGRIVFKFIPCGCEGKFNCSITVRSTSFL